MTNELIKFELELLDNSNKELCNEIYKFFKTVPQGMSAFQIKNFVLGNLEHPTIDSKYWQAKLELFVRLQNIISMHYDYRKRKATIRMLKAKIEECYDKKNCAIKSYEKELFDAKAERYSIEIEENEFALMNIIKTVNDKLLEMQTFWETMQYLEPLLEFSNENKEEMEETFWKTKAEYTPELKLRFPEVFNPSRKEYDELQRQKRKVSKS